LGVRPLNCFRGELLGKPWLRNGFLLRYRFRRQKRLKSPQKFIPGGALPIQGWFKFRHPEYRHEDWLAMLRFRTATSPGQSTLTPLAHPYGPALSASPPAQAKFRRPGRDKTTRRANHPNSVQPLSQKYFA
jgi:hypothetical protein